MIELQDIAMSYSLEQSHLQVLDGACLSVAQGDTVAIVGPSGSGKTTLLVLLAGLEQPQSGDIRIDGVALGGLDVDALADLRRDSLGIIFQSFHLVQSLTALGNAALPLQIAGKENARERALEMLDKVGLAERHNHYPAQLSGGEQQRVAIARALVHQPRLVLVIGLLLLILDLIVRGIRHAARRLDEHPKFNSSFTLRLALANLHRPGSALRSSLLSLGSALTLLVACTLIVAALLRSLQDTIPEEAPGLVLYDVFSDQVDAVVGAVEALPSVSRIELAPLVHARITGLNGRGLDEVAELDVRQQRDSSQDRYKLSYLVDNIDGVTLVDGAWWTDPVAEPPKLAMEDREANKLGLRVGDRLTFAIEARSVDVELAAIYSQKGLQTRFWFEGILSQGVLDPFIHRHVGAVYIDDADAITAQNLLGEIAPNVISVRTESLLQVARQILGKAGAGLAVVSVVSLVASLLVLISVMAAGRSRQIYDATILHSLGVRLALIRRSLLLEYLLLALVASLFALLLGSAIALPLLQWRLKLPSADLVWLGALVAIGVSSLALGLGASYLMRRLRLRPAILLRSPS